MAQGLTTNAQLLSFCWWSRWAGVRSATWAHVLVWPWIELALVPELQGAWLSENKRGQLNHELNKQYPKSIKWEIKINLTSNTRWSSILWHYHYLHSIKPGSLATSCNPSVWDGVVWVDPLVWRPDKPSYQPTKQPEAGDLKDGQPSHLALSTAITSKFHLLWPKIDRSIDRATPVRFPTLAKKIEIWNKN